MKKFSKEFYRLAPSDQRARICEEIEDLDNLLTMAAECGFPQPDYGLVSLRKQLEIFDRTGAWLAPLRRTIESEVSA